MTVEVIECEQNSPEWFAARNGLPTASCFKFVLAGGEGKTRTEYMEKLAGEILTKRPMSSYSNQNMERGKEKEDEARRFYAMITDTEPRKVGFIKNGRKGCSPDALIGHNGMLEIKSHEEHVLINKIRRWKRLGTAPPEHMAQFQGNLWVAEREWIDHAGYCPDLPLFKIRIYRDESYIRRLMLAMNVFIEELDGVVEEIRQYQKSGRAIYDDAIPG